jgi:hypothetical protein
MGLAGAVERAGVHAIRALALQRGVHAALDERAPDAGHRGGMHLQGPGDGRVGPAGTTLALVSFEQDAGAGQHPRRGGPAPHQGPQLGTLGFRQGDGILGLAHTGSPCGNGFRV